jgi:hypothetical protein
MKTIGKLVTAAIAALLIAATAVRAQEAGEFASRFAGGLGTAESPYLISTPQQFSDLRMVAQQRGHLSEYVSSIYYKLVNDIDISQFSTENWGSGWGGGKGWKPVEEFHGHLDGDSHSVTGLWVDQDTQNTTISNTGLFGRIYGTVTHLGVKTDASKGGVKGLLRVGGIAGVLAQGGTLSDCHVTGEVGGYGGINNHVGGLAGSADPESLVENCSMTGSITVLPSGGGLVGGTGGLVGEMAPGLSTTSGLTVQYRAVLVNSFSSCRITVAGRTGTAGGLVGHLGLGEIGNCYATGDIIASGGEMTDPLHVGSVIGGLVGRVTGTGNVYNCHVTGRIGDGTEESRGPVAGALPGYYTGSIESGPVPASLTVSNCYFLQEADGINSHVDPLATQGFAPSGEMQEIHPGTPLPFIDGAGVALTAAGMREQDSFAGFDFEKVWKMDEGDGYPVLRTSPLSGPDGDVAGSADSPKSAVTLKAYAAGGMLHVTGLTPGGEIRVCDAAGRTVYTGRAAATVHDIPLTGRGVHIVIAGGHSVKVIL